MDSDKRPDLLIESFGNNFRNLLVDFSLARPIKEPGHALKTRCNSKMDKYYNQANQINCDFLPFVIETLGLINNDGIRLIKDLTALCSEDACDWFQKISVTVQKSLAAGARTLLQQSLRNSNIYIRK